MEIQGGNELGSLKGEPHVEPCKNRSLQEGRRTAKGINEVTGEHMAPRLECAVLPAFHFLSHLLLFP